MSTNTDEREETQAPTTEEGIQALIDRAEAFTADTVPISPTSEGRRIETIIESQATTVQDNSQDTLASGITEHLWAMKSSNSKSLFVGSLPKEFIFIAIKEYLCQLNNIDVLYNRKQLITDVILMVKRDGNAAAGKILIDLLGFNAVSETYKITSIDYKDVPINEEDYNIGNALQECRDNIITSED